MSFDRSKPYGTISGKTEDGARFKQNGVRYLPNGRPVDGSGVAEPEAKPVATAPEPPAPPPPLESEQPEAVAPTPPPVAGAGPDYENMHHMILKKMVKDAGGEYVDREQAIAFMENLG